MNEDKPAIEGKLVTDKDILNSLNIVVSELRDGDSYVKIRPWAYNRSKCAYEEKLDPDFLKKSLKRLGIYSTSESDMAGECITIKVIENSKPTASLDALIKNLDHSETRPLLENLRDGANAKIPKNLYRGWASSSFIEHNQGWER